ncbi:mediator-associated protein 2 [Momordica charantia]|uniref:Mediator-associated protein 2 n=1 Tax=Momordica charantia TaxID=3673 RepID=A0A6J1CDR9_MOMCH|nr:mediator-associated protein 2 [Momordica charantia]XP_022139367.1 mediator-associated protein 2 [Momordica charantia]
MSNEFGAFKRAEEYKPAPEFEEDDRELLADISLSDSTELWLIQWPANQPPDFDGQEFSLQLHHDGHLGSFQGSSGKSYDVVSCVAQEPEASVFLPSSSDTKLVGKISRRISLVHYPEPEELEQATAMKSAFQKSSGISLTTSSRQTTSRTPHSSSRRTSSSKPRSSVSEYEEPSKPSSRKREPEPSESKDHLKKDSSKRKHAHEPSRSTDRSTQNLGRSHSAVTFSGASGQSSEGKTKR